MNRRRHSGSAGGWAAAAAIVLFAGCVHLAPPPPPRPSPAAAVTLESLPAYLLPRVAAVFWGTAGLALTTASAPGDAPHTGIKFPPQGPAGSGFAAAIDPRGYFLTAAHVVRREPIYVVWPDGKPGQLQPRLLRARVVFRGQPAGQGTDLAILRVDSPLAAVFAWAPTYAEGEPVVAVGSAGGAAGQNATAAALLGGHLVGSLADPEASPPRVTLFHTAPIRPGSSGGPLLTTDGQLLGINVEFGVASTAAALGPPSGAAAHRPDLAWLRQVIAADWAQHPDH